MAKELYVGHISENANEDDIRKLFSVMGDVTSVHLIIDPDTGEFKRCGYIRMASEVDLREVVETLDGALLVDRVITVSIARPQKPGMSSRKPGARRPGQGGRGAFGAPPAAGGEKSGVSRSPGSSGAGAGRGAVGGGQGRATSEAGQERRAAGTGRVGRPVGQGRSGGGGPGRSAGAPKTPRKGR